LYNEVVSTRTVVASVVACMLGAGCSSSAARGRAVVTTTVTRGVVTAAPCAVPNRFGTDGAPTELHVATAATQVWGLAMGPGHVPPRVGEELKIVWRMTGTGPLRVVFRAPDGHTQPLVFGPEPHGSSSYQRPGDEWGTGFRFPVRGCWSIHLARNDAGLDIHLVVN
jgi:hypothetical protein